MCPGCRSLDSVWLLVSGRAAIFSYVICHPPVLPAFRERTPYAVVLVELAGAPGIRMVGNLLEAPASSARVGLPVEVCFEEVGGGVVLPQWRPASRNQTVRARRARSSSAIRR